MGVCGSKKEDYTRQPTLNTARPEVNLRVSQNTSEADTLDDVEDYLREPELISPTPNHLYNESEILDKSIHQVVCKPRKAAFRRKSKDWRGSTDSGIVDAWKQKKGIPKHTFSEKKNNNKTDQISIDESEYGKEGIDLVSTAEPQQRYQPVGYRSSPDGVQDFEQNTALRLYKEESDETFDPSKLVDIEKFKAANFPSTKPKSDGVESQVQKEKGFGVEEDISGASIPYSDRVTDRGTGHRRLQRPSDIYDADERALMESIEKDFVQMSLPGAVA